MKTSNLTGLGTSFGTLQLGRSGVILSPKRGSVMIPDSNYITEENIMLQTSRNLTMRNPIDDLKHRRFTSLIEPTNAPIMTQNTNYPQNNQVSPVLLTKNSKRHTTYTQHTPILIEEQKQPQVTLAEVTKKKKSSSKKRDEGGEKKSKRSKKKSLNDSKTKKTKDKKKKGDERVKEKSKKKKRLSKKLENGSKVNSTIEEVSTPQKVPTIPLENENINNPYSLPTDTVMSPSSTQSLFEPLSPLNYTNHTDVPSREFINYNNPDIEPVNIDLVTSSMCVFIKEAINKDLGKLSSDIRPLFNATKELSVSLKETYRVTEIYSTVLSDYNRKKLLLTNEKLKTDIVDGLFTAIKAIHQDSRNVQPLKKVIKNLADIIHELYICLEGVNVHDAFSALQTHTLKMKDFVIEAKEMSEDNFQNSMSLLVVSTMEMCSFVIDYSFINTKTKTNRRILYESCVNISQMTRSLIVHMLNLRADLKNEGHKRNLTSCLKSIAEQIRTISKCIKDENNIRQSIYLIDQCDLSYTALEDKELDSLFVKATSIIANARSKYISKSKAQIAKDEKELLAHVATIIQLFKYLSSALFDCNYELLMGTVILITENISKISDIVFPIIDTCLNSVVVQEIVQCLENLIRSQIQLKILSSKISVNNEISEYKDPFGYTVMISGIFLMFLLDACYRATHDI